MEADLLPLGVDLLDLWRGTLSLRRLLVLVRHLPASSAVSRVERDGLDAWTVEAELLDLIRVVTMRAAGAKQVDRHPMSPAAKTGTAETRHDPRRMAATRARAIRRRRRLQGPKPT